MLKKYLMYMLVFIGMFLFLISPPHSMNKWQTIKARGYIKWVTRPSPLTYYNSLDGVIGLEYDLLKNFSDKHGIGLEVIIANSNAELFNHINTKNIDIAGANLTLTESRTKIFLTSSAYDETYIRLISSLALPKISSVAEVNKFSGAVLKNSSYADAAKNIPLKHVQFSDVESLYELLKQVVNNEIDYTFADSNIIDIFKVYMPKLRIGLKVSKLEELIFIMPKSTDHSLKKEIDEYIDEYINSNQINNYKNLIKDTLPNSRPADTVNFLMNYEKRWPLVKGIILKTAIKFDISPILLGAISYQESHWNPQAISPTLVKGLMMLTKAVAQEVGVIDRNNPLQSIEGGTEYFIKMKNKIPKRILEPNKTNFALVAYNIGFGNLEKARRMAQKEGQDPDLWKDVKEYLIKFNTIDAIKADGQTAVRYVENIHVYQNLLQWKEQQ